MKNKSTMDTRLRMIEELYDGDGNLADRIRIEQPDLLDELKAMQSVKSALDARSARRPDLSTVDAVVRAAADASAGLQPAGVHPRRRQDRKPRARRAGYLRSAGVATAVLTVLLTVTTVWRADYLDEFPEFTGEGTVTEGMAEDGQSSAAHSAQQETGERVARGEAARAGLGPGDGDARAGKAVAENGPARADRASADEGSAGADRELAVGLYAEDGRQAKAGRYSSTAEYETFSPQAAGLREITVAGDAGVDGNAAATSAVLEFSGQAAMYRPMSLIFGTDVYRDRGDNLLMRRRPSDILPVGMRPNDMIAFPNEPENDDLAWDQAGDVMEMFQQIEMLGEGVARGWEPPSVPLEMLPASQQRLESGIQPAGERRIP